MALVRDITASSSHALAGMTASLRAQSITRTSTIMMITTTTRTGGAAGVH